MFLQKKYLGDFGADFFRCTDMKGGGGLRTLPRFFHAIAPGGEGGRKNHQTGGRPAVCATLYRLAPLS